MPVKERVLPATPPQVDAAPAVPRDAIDVLLEDREWLEAEFAAVMRAAGFVGRRATAAVLPLPEGRGAPVSDPAPRSDVDAGSIDVRARARIRSPPS